MTGLRRRLALTVLAALLALGSALPAVAGELPWPASAPAAAAQEHEGSAENTSGLGITSPVVWTIAGVVIGGLFLSVFYLFKRRVGGFPRNPSWVAPITVMESSDFPDETTFGDLPAEAHAHH